MSRRIPIPYAELPDQCYAEINGHLVIIKKGAKQFERSPLDTGEAKGCREIARLKNEQLGVTPRQAAVLCSGYVFGWDTMRQTPPHIEMSGHMFEVYISSPYDLSGNSGVSIGLPATPFVLEDALEQARVTQKHPDYSVEIEVCKLDYLPQLIAPGADLYELNHLAQRLTELKDEQFDCFEGMIKMETEENGNAPIPLERLINFTHSTEDCQIAYGAHNDSSLGAFYVDNDFPVIPEGLPKELYGILDLTAIGRKAREGEGGVFTPHGYVVHSGKMAEVYHSGDAVPKEKPGYTIMLEVRKGFFNDPEYDNQFSEFPMLPNDDGALHRAAAQVDATSLEECSISAVDCIVPALTERITDALEYDVSCYSMVNELAEQLSRLERKGLLTTYKAMLAAAPSDITLEEAHDLSCEVEGFILSKELESSSDYAREQLRKCGVPMLDELCGMANLHKYGGLLMAGNHVQYTPYGLLRSVDGQTVEEVLRQKTPEQVLQSQSI